MSQSQQLNILGFFARNSSFQTQCHAHEVTGNLEYKASVRTDARKLNSTGQVAVLVAMSLQCLVAGKQVANGEFVVEAVADLSGYTAREEHEILNIFLPNQAVPYLRELASNATSRTGYPTFIMPPFIVQQNQPHTALAGTPALEAPELKRLT